MTAGPSVLVLGGGLSGMSAAYALARSGHPVTIVERGDELGGLAGTFEKEGHFYPLGYHHILHRDRTLLYFLDAIGALEDVRWRKIRMLFRLDGKLHDLADPVQFLRFPMRFTDKLRFARLMLRSFGKTDWSEWHGRSAAELVDAWAGPGVRRTIFEPLTRLKFDLPGEEVSAAWLGARLYFREGSAPLGYIPGKNWTKVLCDGITDLLREAGVTVLLDNPVERVHHDDARFTGVDLADGRRLEAEIGISTLPTEVYASLAPHDRTEEIHEIRYTALVSAICASKRPIARDFYWMNLASLDCNACGIFRLDSLNPTIGAQGDSCVNFVTHIRSRDSEVFRRSDDELLSGYREDFRKVFGFELDPFWTNVARVPMYSPIFGREYRNPPVRSRTFENLYFAGNYRTFPSVASTGTALRSGIEAASAILSEHAAEDDLPARVDGFRLRSMPRA